MHGDGQDLVAPPPWFIATAVFDPSCGDWDGFVEWSGLTQLDEVVSLDPMLCPTLLEETKDEYWPHIVDGGVLIDFFVDLDYLLGEIESFPRRNLLCVHRDPVETPAPHAGAVEFEHLGHDLVDREGGASALTNCGGWPDVFSGRELNRKGLLDSLDRARAIRSELAARYPDEHHADCHVWAIARAVARP